MSDMSATVRDRKKSINGDNTEEAKCVLSGLLQCELAISWRGASEKHLKRKYRQ